MKVKDRINILKEKYIRAKNDAELDAVRNEMQELCDEDVVAVAEAAFEIIKEASAEPTRDKLKDA